MLKLVVSFTLLVISLFGANIAIVKKTSGEVFAKRDTNMIALKPGVKLFEGDILITKKNGKVGIIFDDGTLLSLGENSILNINKYIFKPATNDFDIDLDMKKGVAAFQSGKIGRLSPKSVKFKIPEGTIGIRGTKFLVQVN
jgi:hypothetical protein